MAPRAARVMAEWQAQGRARARGHRSEERKAYQGRASDRHRAVEMGPLAWAQALAPLLVCVAAVAGGVGRVSRSSVLLGHVRRFGMRLPLPLLVCLGLLTGAGWGGVGYVSGSNVLGGGRVRLKMRLPLLVCMGLASGMGWGGVGYVSGSNVLGRVRQLEIELRNELQVQLKGRLIVALNASSLSSLSSLPSSSSSSPSSSPGTFTLLKSSDIVAHRGAWPLYDASLAQAKDVPISEDSPLCVFTPLPQRGQLEALQRSMESDQHVAPSVFVSSRLLHAGRLVRLARGFAARRRNLPGGHHRRRPREPDLRPALLYVVAPDEVAEVVCRVVHDELAEWTVRGVCVAFSQALRDAQGPGSEGAQGKGGKGGTAGGDEGVVGVGQKKQCGFALWGSSASQEFPGRSVALAVSSFQVGIEIDLDKGDAETPPTFTPSWIPASYGPFSDPSDASVRLIDPQKSAEGGGEGGGPYTIVTAFSWNHYTVGLRLMNSILVAGPSREVPFSLVVYTMEKFTPEAREQVLCVARELKKAGIPVVIRAFDFNKYPVWMYIRHYKAGWWAWKGVMVWETFVQRRGAVLWLDAGDVISSPEALPGTFRSLEREGFVGITRDWFGMNYRWTHPGMITFLGVDVDSTTTQCCGCLFGVTPEVYARFIRPAFECSLTLQCIAPEGSSMGNHRQDQSMLSVLAWHNGLACNGSHADLLWKCDGGRNHCSEPPKGGATELCSIK